MTCPITAPRKPSLRGTETVRAIDCDFYHCLGRRFFLEKANGSTTTPRHPRFDAKTGREAAVGSLEKFGAKEQKLFVGVFFCDFLNVFSLF